MAMITCSECGKEFSDKADKCPSCGNPNPTYVSEDTQPEKQKKKKKKGIGKKILIAVVVVIVLLVAISSLDGGGGSQSISEESKSMSEDDFKSACESIDYSEIFRNSDNYNGTKVKFKGQIQQVVTDKDNYSEYLISVTKDEYGLWSDNIYVYLDRENVSDKFLEDDVVTFYGESNGTYSYKNVMGSKTEVPSVTALYMDLKKSK
jgi:predicted  nucleic acid-binding Zn-ribbon protein